MQAINVHGQEPIVLILDYLRRHGLCEAMRALERESGISAELYGKELTLVRSLLLDGSFRDLEDFLQPLRRHQAFDYDVVLFEIRKQRFLELVAAQQLNNAVVTLVDELKELEATGCSQAEYSDLCYLLTLPRLTDHHKYRSWTIHAGRARCFDAIRPAFRAVYPAADAQARMKPNRLDRLLKQALAYQVSRWRFLNPTADLPNPLFLTLLDDFADPQEIAELGDDELLIPAPDDLECDVPLRIAISDPALVPRKSPPRKDLQQRLARPATPPQPPSPSRPAAPPAAAPAPTPAAAPDPRPPVAWSIPLETGGADRRSKPASRPAAPPVVSAVAVETDTPVVSTAFHPEHDILAVATEDSLLALYGVDMDHDGELQELHVCTDHHDRSAIVDLSWSADGSMLASTGLDGAVRIMHFNDAFHTRRDDDDVFRVGSFGLHAVAFAAHDDHLAAGGPHLWIWNLDRPESPLELADHRDQVTAIAARSSAMFATGSLDATVRLWDPRVEHSVAGDPIQLDSAVTALTALAPHTLAVGSITGAVDLVDLRQGAIVESLRPSHSEACTSLAASASGQWLVSGGRDATAFVRPLSGRGSPIPIREHKSAVACVSWHAQRDVFVSGGEDCTLRLTDLDLS